MSGQKKLEFHPLADVFPILPEKELAELADDIGKNGLRGPITLYEGRILDGRNRYLACERNRIEPKYRPFTGDDPIAFVISANLRRRHLNTSQRSMIAAKLATMQEGRPSKTSSNEPVSIQQAAKALHVSPASVKRARKLLHERPAEAEAIQRGEKTLPQAQGTPEGATDSIPVDKTGYPIPPKALEYWKRREEPEDVLYHISKARAAVKDLQDSKDPMWAEVNSNSVYADLCNAYRNFKLAVPYAVCPACQGQAPATCTLCGGAGFDI